MHHPCKEAFHHNANRSENVKSINNDADRSDGCELDGENHQREVELAASAEEQDAQDPDIEQRTAGVTFDHAQRKRLGCPDDVHFQIGGWKQGLHQPVEDQHNREQPDVPSTHS